MHQVLWLSGPLFVRDAVGGVGGLIVALAAFTTGCAFASAGNIAWFAFLGLLGVVSVHTSLSQLRRVRDVLAPVANEPDISLPLAA
jgi:hypothetical protein